MRARNMGKRALLRYAGAAPQALIGSKPIGSELACSSIFETAGSQPWIDKPDNLSYVAPNRTPHASASVCAPGGSFFAQRAGTAGSL